MDWLKRHGLIFLPRTLTLIFVNYLHGTPNERFYIHVVSIINLKSIFVQNKSRFMV
jgi:hypothetical protein